MLYFAPPNSVRVREAMTAGNLGAITSPRAGDRALPMGVPWVADNGCFAQGWPGAERWLAWLNSFPPEQRARCLFAVAPDVVGDAAATLALSLPHLETIRALGFPAAYVAQDGQQDVPVPWDDLDALFIGGSTPFKLGPHARDVIAEALARDVWVHMGRVNSEKRIRYAAGLGVSSVDGTMLAFAPDYRLPEVLGWVRAAHEPMLWEPS